MKHRALLSVYFLLVIPFAESSDLKTEIPPAKTPKHGNNLTITTNTNTTTTAVVHQPTESNYFNPTTLNGSMIQRALYVLIGITIVGVLYFLVRAVRLKKTTAQRKKYGLLSNYDDTVEMAQLESDEEDTTVYEAKSLRR